MREDVWEYPLEAVREALVNAVCHRDYEDSGSIQLRIYDDRLEVWNPGALPAGVTVADLHREHDSVRRNPRLAEALFLAGLVEKWGTGTLRMIAACRSAGLAEPQFASGPRTFVVTLTKAPPDVHAEDAVLSHRREAILEHVRSEGSATSAQLAAALGISERAVLKHTAFLLERGLLHRTGAARSSRYAPAESGTSAGS